MVKKFAIDPYIVFDGKRNEIRMEIPIEELMNPDKNEKLKESWDE